MDFHLPFPTLKHLTMVCIGKVTLNKEIRPPRKLGELDEDGNEIYMFEVEKIVAPLDITDTIKHDLSDVITGMFRQVELSDLIYDLSDDITSECYKRLEKRELLYDVHGRLDLATFWKRFFDSEVSELDTLDPLLDLLDFVLGKGLHHGLDAILSKILSVVCRDATVSFKKRKLVHCRSRRGFGDYGYAFVYRFDKSGTAIRYLSQLQSTFSRRRSIVMSEGVVVNNDALYVYLRHDIQYRLEYEFFRDYFRRAQHSMNESGKLTFVSKVLYDWYFNSKCVVEILKTLDWEKQRQCFAAVSEMESDHDGTERLKNMFYHMLQLFLEWPNTHFFIPFLEFALPNMSTEDVSMFKTIIGYTIPERGRFGVLYGDLLAKYRQAITPEV